MSKDNSDLIVEMIKSLTERHESEMIMIRDAINNLRDKNKEEHKLIISRLDYMNGGFRDHEKRLTKIETTESLRDDLISKKFRTNTYWVGIFGLLVSIINIVAIVTLQTFYN